MSVLMFKNDLERINFYTRERERCEREKLLTTLKRLDRNANDLFEALWEMDKSDDPDTMRVGGRHD